MTEVSTPSFAVYATAGTLRSADGITLTHAWTDAGVMATAVTNGAQVLHLSVALCVLNDLYREAARLDAELDGVAVRADGSFDEDWHSTGITYDVELDSSTDPIDLARLIETVDGLAEIPRVIRAGATVTRRV